MWRPIIALAMLVLAGQPTLLFAGVKPITGDGGSVLIAAPACEQGTLTDELQRIKDQIAKMGDGHRPVIMKVHTKLALDFAKKLLGDGWQEWGDQATDVRSVTSTGEDINGGFLFLADKSGCFLGFIRLRAASFQKFMLINARGSA